MKPADWQRVEAIFHDALERPALARAAFLDEACAGDVALLNGVNALLAGHDADEDFLAPVVDVSTLGADAPAPGGETRIGAYRLVRQIGAGGMGVVYLAVHEGPDFERPVALKVIRRGLDTDELLKRFRLERRILAALKHPNVARLTDAGQTPDGRPYFVMDFVEGSPIDEYCDEHHVDLRGRLTLFLMVCDAVQHAHGNLIVHRDLKPSNILVSKDGVPVLLDFGIGKLLEPGQSAEDSRTRTGARAFTPEYAAPEQIRGDPVTTATDVYGLGMLLYVLLARRRPFPDATGIAFEKAVLETEPPKPSTFGGRELAGDLDTIVLKTLRKEPERRYTSVAALGDDVRRFLDGLPVRARPDTFGYRSGKFVRRHAVAVAAAIITTGSLVTATAYSVLQARAVARERDKAVDVETFLLEMFGASGRDHADTVSVRQLLDAQASVLPTAYPDNPEMRAQMTATIAEGYDRLGLFAQAEPLARDALSQRRAILAPTNPDLAVSTSLLGWILFERGQAKDGEALLRDAVQLWRRVSPENPRGLARTLNDLGVAVEASGDYAEADSLYRRALIIRRRLFGEHDRAVATTLSNLSVVLYRKGDLKGAVAAAESALVVMRAVMGPDHNRSTIVQNNLAAFRSTLGDAAGAEAEYRDLVARQTRVLGRQNPQTAGSINGLASVLRAEGKYAEAEPLLVETLATYQAAFGPKHARVANTLIQLGGVRSSMKRFAEARPLLERALSIQRALRGGDTHRDVAQAMSALATMEGDAGNWTDAERGHRAALAVWMRAMGDKHVETATARGRLAKAVYMNGRPAEAYGLYKEAEGAMVAAGVKETSGQLKLIRDQMAVALQDSIRAKR
jgi:eukaryotic-like serine/threonine-protein kinase